ncbi:single-stranded DNA-binding protein 3 [Silurus asotus]|uniref:Single-stranded DNA-binding protein 3 n=1 Tax=Silurus asotus TaxID=30991 RepID=A0AAD5A426_SILAS|nr:single-stranded DNA-binding protein 3 [Silurus asotus]
MVFTVFMLLTFLTAFTFLLVLTFLTVLTFITVLTILTFLTVLMVLTFLTVITILTFLTVLMVLAFLTILTFLTVLMVLTFLTVITVLTSAAAAPSPVLGNLPPGDGMPGGPMPPGFFQGPTGSQASPHSQPPPNANMMGAHGQAFMSPRYAGGPRPPIRMSNQPPGGQPLPPNIIDPTRPPGHPNLGPMQRMNMPRGMSPMGPGPQSDPWLSLQTYGGGMRPPNSMGPNMPGVNMGPGTGRPWPNPNNTNTGPPGGGGGGCPPGTPIMPSPAVFPNNDHERVIRVRASPSKTCTQPESDFSLTPGRCSTRFCGDLMIKENGDQVWYWMFKFLMCIFILRNYRGIKMISHTMKFWERVVEARLREEVTICEQQDGFMLRKSTTDTLFALRMLMETNREGQKELHCVWIWRKRTTGWRKRGVVVLYEEVWCVREGVRVEQDVYEDSVTAM